MSELEARHEAARVGDEDASNPLPVVDFPLLDQARTLDLIDLKPDFPESLKALEGRRVALVGFMAPFDSLNDMRRCMIVPSYVGCTFCSPPSLTQVVYVTQGRDEGSAGSYPFIEPASYVTGILRLSQAGSDHEGNEQGFLYSLEDAVVTPYTGETSKRAPGHGTTASGQPDHQQGASQTPPVELADLVGQVAVLLGREPLRPIEIEVASTEAFRSIIRGQLEATFPEATRAARARAFSLLGMFPADANWIDIIAGNQLDRRVTATEEMGELVYLLGSVSPDHPYVRLELVGEIAAAIVGQHFPSSLRGFIGTDGEEKADENDDARRAREALWSGVRTMAIYRYARTRGISPGTEPPSGLVSPGEERTIGSMEFALWQSLPSDVGPFFVDFFIGAMGPFSRVDSALAMPPTTTIECFRPRWYEDSALWRHDPVPSDFADTLMETKPILTDVLGIGGLIPLLARWYSVDVAKRLAGQWAGDRWAIWQLPDGDAALMLETRWQDEDSAIQFREAIPNNDPFQLIAPHEAGSSEVRLLRGSSESALARLVSAVETAP